MAARSIGRYPVVRLLGTGGFATVYLARDDRLDADVAVKVLAENWCHDPEISRRFLDEARLLRRCDDDRVVRVHTIEQLEDGRPYFVMDYADAGTLADRMLARLDGGRAFALREAVQLACELADCLTVVHDCGIVHRDLKPSNVLFRTGRSGQRMVLGDFGLARQMLTATGRTILAGTPEYVAPEQADPASAATVDERADVYAAAVILYELLAGAVPFGHSSLDQAASARQGPPDLGAVRGDVPPALVAVLGRGMAPDPDRRYPTGRAWLAALLEVHAGLPIPLGPATLSPSASVGPPGAPPVPPGATATVPPGFAEFVPGTATPSPGVPDHAAPRPAPVPPGPAPVPPRSVAPPGGAGAAPGARTATEDAPDGDTRPPRVAAGHKPLWPLFAGILAALALVAAAAVLIGRNGAVGSSTAGTAAAPSVAPTSAPPPSTAVTPAPAPAPALTGPAAWFAAASASSCRPATSAQKVPGMIAAVTCTFPGVVAVFGQTSSPAEASSLLIRLHNRRAGSAYEPWPGGDAVTYGSGQPGVAWDSTGHPYVAIAVSDNRATLTAWWVSSGRTVRPGA